MPKGHPAYPYQAFGDLAVTFALSGNQLVNVKLRLLSGQFFKGQPSQKDLYDAVKLGVRG